MILYLEHIKRTPLIALTNHYLADQVGILSNQHVLETVDLKELKNVQSPFNSSKHSVLAYLHDNHLSAKCAHEPH